MKPFQKAVIFACAIPLLTPPAAAQEAQELAGEGAKVIMQLASTLQGELQAAMKAGGPMQALDICNLEAQTLTFGISEANPGWEISRTSHRLRNPANAPDAYETNVMANFLARVENGEDVQSIVSAQIVEDNGQRSFRMIKAIPTGEPCLACHGGSEVSAAVQAKLADYYPEDLARNFAVGDMRGVFTLTKVLD